MRTLGTPIDFAGLEARNLRAHVLAAAPSSPVSGQIYYNSVDGNLYVWDGTASAWVDLTMQGTVTPDATTTTKGQVQLAGDLAGTAASPQIAANVIVNGDINAAAAIARSKLDFGSGLVNADIATGAAIAYAKLNLTTSIVNGDIAAGAAIVYSKLNLGASIVNGDIAAGAAIALTKLATDPLARANHTGTQLAATISNFDPQVRTSRLDQMAAAGADINLGGFKATNAADPTANTDLATKQYVDALVQGLDAKGSVRVAYTANVSLTGAATTEGGVTPANGERVLAMAQTTPSQNGIWVVNTGGAWTRATDADSWNELVSAFVFVEQGTQADNGFTSTVDPGGTLNTTAVTWTQFSGAGQITAGNGLSKTGNTLDVNVDSSSIEINADILRVKALGITNAMLAGGIDLASKVTGTLPLGNGGTGQTTAKAARETGLGATGFYSSATHGAITAGGTLSITQATHGLRAQKGLIVLTYDEATGDQRLDDINVNAAGDVTITYANAQSANTIRTTIVG